MKTAFLSTSDRALPVLEALNKNPKLVLCITKTDVKVGRDHRLKENEIKLWCRANNTSCLQIETLKNEDLKKVIEQLDYSKPDLILVIDFGVFIPEEIINKYRGKIVNIHFSLLPKYRGASPAQFAILNGDETTGVTFQLVENKLDSGDILKQYEYKIPNNITSGLLYEKLFLLTAEKLSEFLKDFENGKLTPLPQDESKAIYTYSKTHPKSTLIYKEDAYTDFSETPLTLERKVRAFNPWPIVWTHVGNLERLGFKLKPAVNRNLTLKIYKCEVEPSSRLNLIEVQVEGKNKMSWKDFCNGYLATD